MYKQLNGWMEKIKDKQTDGEKDGDMVGGKY